MYGRTIRGITQRQFHWTIIYYILCQHTIIDYIDVSPISGSTCSLERVDTGVDTDSSRSSHGALKRLNDSIHSESAHPSDFHRLGDPGPPMTQTGYKTNFIGLVLYYLIILMNLVVQILLLALTVEYCKLFCVCVS
jgi:hypothetical protein